MDTKFDMNVSKEMLLNAGKCQGLQPLTFLELLSLNQQGGKILFFQSLPRLGLT